ncbi:integral membrane sensor signal transduction histidine kinase [Flammeovirgaceae bacterium 311]|nr:integral membrane sensor signal transduction histidine kinase [Flammeovirgaceae bacterium 311]
MSIRKKILLYFSVVTIVLVGIALIFIYTLFYEYREEEFQQQQKDKITTTLRFLTEIRGIDERLIQSMDQITINELYDEKLLIFNEDKKLIYASIDDTSIPYTRQMLDTLSATNPWIELKDGLYDVVGMYHDLGNGRYFGISKAYDVTGYHNLNYLRYVLSLTFLGISVVVIFMSYYLSKKITNPIVTLTSKIKDYDFSVKPASFAEPGTRNEVAILTQRFNELMKRMNEAYSFQKHAVHHISHELKTPIAILVSNLEKIEKETDLDKVKEMIRNQKHETMNLSEIINSLLEIAKTESGNLSLHTHVRVDEMIFDLADELNKLNPDFQFSIDYACNTEFESNLTVLANDRLLKAALSNLMINCMQYSNDNKAKIAIKTAPDKLQIDFTNNGAIISDKEHSFLFQHFFRGENSKGKRGFGLGLVFVHKILALHRGEISYVSETYNSNTFSISLPLS